MANLETGRCVASFSICPGTLEPSPSLAGTKAEVDEELLNSTLATNEGPESCITKLAPPRPEMAEESITTQYIKEIIELNEENL